MNNFELAKEYFLNGCILLEAENFFEAENQFKKSLRLIPNRASTLTNLSVVQLKLKKYSEAKFSAEQAILFELHNSEAYLNLGLIEQELRNLESAIHYFDKALSLNPSYAEAWSNKGNVLNDLKHHNDAIDHHEKALDLNPSYAEAWSNKGNVLNDLKYYHEAIIHFDKALSLKPNYIQAWINKASALNSLKDHSESAKLYLKALGIKKEGSEASYLLGLAHHQMMLSCDWSDYEGITNQINTQIDQRKACTEPFGFQGVANSEARLKECAKIFSDDKFPALENLISHSKYEHHKIRIGYLCGEFRSQATSILMARVWELHDKSKFEIFAFDSGWNDGSDYRLRIEKAFSHVFDISHLSDLGAAKLIQDNEIDILINLNGFFGLGRQGVFSYKPAPIQVNYLGFPGTIGAKYIDYIIADQIVLPHESKEYYVEKVVHLPNSYQANDDQRKISNRKFTKHELGLPENGFIFACFNNNYKIVPSTFDVWCKILMAVKGSILWLLEDNPIAKKNIIKEAISRGIDSTRLVFAERLNLAEHLARHKLADLFLDTLPYNAHTTCSDALWAGLPVLTLKGNTFPGRVSASLLSGMGLNQLITYSQEEFEAMAIHLAINPEKLDVIREKLACNLLSSPLFNSLLFTKNLESAYIKMHERYESNLQPDHITIA